MTSDLKMRVKKAGQPPGTLIYTGNKTDVKPAITVISYNGKDFKEWIGSTPDGDIIMPQEDYMTWIHVEGLRDISIVNKIAMTYSLHPLTIEDILNVSQRSKVEDFDNYIFITMKVLCWNSQLNETEMEQLSLVIGDSFVLSFMESKTTLFTPIRERIKTGQSQNLTKNGSDYLAYRLMDITIDQYFVSIEMLSDQIEQIEEKIVANPTADNAGKIYNLKHSMLVLRKAVWPIREEISHLLQVDHKFITPFTHLYLRDLYDHIVQAIDTIEILRDMLSSILDIYLSLVTNKLNEVMKILTIISTIFIPITFITSLYGMNFKYMPELNWRWGYPTTLGIMAVISWGMIIYFRRKKWL